MNILHGFIALGGLAACIAYVYFVIVISEIFDQTLHAVVVLLIGILAPIVFLIGASS